MFGGITNVSYGGAPLTKTIEKIVLILLGVISIGLLKGGAYASLTVLQINAFYLDRLTKHHSNFIRHNLVGPSAVIENLK